MNLFAMERQGFAFNNADSQEVVDGGDYENELIKKAKKKQDAQQLRTTRKAPKCKTLKKT